MTEKIFEKKCCKRTGSGSKFYLFNHLRNIIKNREKVYLILSIPFKIRFYRIESQQKLEINDGLSKSRFYNRKILLGLLKFGKQTFDGFRIYFVEDKLL